MKNLYTHLIHHAQEVGLFSSKDNPYIIELKNKKFNTLTESNNNLSALVTSPERKEEKNAQLTQMVNKSLICGGISLLVVVCIRKFNTIIDIFNNNIDSADI